MRRLKYIIVLSVFLLAACGRTGTTDISPYNLTKTQPDPLSSRRIVLLHPYSGERYDLVYFHDGHYDPKALKQIDHLFRDRHANVTYKIDPELIDYLVDIRTRLDLPPSVTFEILSGYRTPATNNHLRWGNGNVAKESYHMRGWAVDFRIPSLNGGAICEIAKTMQRGGVAYYPEDNHVHVDLGNIRSWKTK